MAKAGFKNIEDLKGGGNEWLINRYPVQEK
jgi:rhodanese-related sulfurtransferase